MAKPKLLLVEPPTSCSEFHEGASKVESKQDQELQLTSSAGNEQPQSPFVKRTDQFEKVSLQLPTELNDWLDVLSKNSRSEYGRKIPKQAWYQAAIELMRAMPTDWEGIESREQLSLELEYLATRINELHEENLIY